MKLAEFFVEELGISEEYWTDNKQELEEISGDAVHRYVNYLPGLRKYDRDSFEITMGITDRLERKDECLAFLSKEILKSELPDKAEILERLTALAFKSPEAYNYPVMDVLDYMSRGGGTVEMEHPEWLVWKDTFSEPKSYVNTLERILESLLSDSRKTAAFIGIAISLRDRKREDLSRKLTTRFFESGEIPYAIREELAWSIITGEFFEKVHAGYYKDTVLMPFKGSSSNPPIIDFPKDLELEFDMDVILEAAEYLEEMMYQTQMKLTVEMEEITEWVLGSLEREEAKSFIRDWLGKKYDYRDFPVVRGIIGTLKDWGGTEAGFVKEAIDDLKNANRYQVRMMAFETGYDVLGDEEYLEEAEKDPSMEVREWAGGQK